VQAHSGDARKSKLLRLAVLPPEDLQQVEEIRYMPGLIVETGMN
jgi:hypothetical protein